MESPKYNLELPLRNLPLFATSVPTFDPKVKTKVEKLLSEVWGLAQTPKILADLETILTEAQKRKSPQLMKRDQQLGTGASWSEKTFYLICYGDHLKSKNPEIYPLQVLRQFLDQHYQAVASNLTVHLLPIYTSPQRDGGFDVADPFAVNPAMGNWDDVADIAKRFNFALDFVINHLSKDSVWFQKFLANDPQFADFFIAFSEDDQSDMAKLTEIRKKYQHLIYRPRAHDPFIRVRKDNGSFSWVYMTFSNHQPDVNYQNPTVFLKMVEILFFYILQGASTLRLDAIPYVWKEWGTSCAHHPKTHKIVELFSLLAVLLSPSVKLLAESMEPPQDSARYLSSAGDQKAQMCYNFLPCGLIPHTLISEDATTFSQALDHFQTPSFETVQAVVCGMTHDGTSLNPCRAPKSIKGKAALTEREITAIANYYSKSGKAELQKRMQLPHSDPLALPTTFLKDFKSLHKEEPRFVNLKSIHSTDGEKTVVYETISTYTSVWKGNAKKIVAAFALGLPLKGIPFLYLTGPFGAFNDFRFYLQTGNPRELNRGRLFVEDLNEQLARPQSLINQILPDILHLLTVRSAHQAFHPGGKQVMLVTANRHIFGLTRTAPDNSETIIALHNISSHTQSLKLKIAAVKVYDVISKQTYLVTNGQLSLTLKPFAIVWLCPQE